MSWMQRLRFTFSGRRMEAEIREEMEHHRELRRRDQLADGLGPEAAERALRRQFGNTERYQERTRDMDILVWLESCLQDLRHAARMLRRSPGFTAIVVLSLAIGIGANAAIFSLINTVLLKTLPVPAPGQIFALAETDGTTGTTNNMSVFSYPVIQQLERAAGSHAALGACSPPQPLPLLEHSGRSLPVQSELVSGGYFSALGIQPLRGRWINDNDNRALGVSPVAVLSYDFWQQQFGGDPSLLGRTITLRGVNLDVVGIAPPGFTGLDPAQPVDLWTPLMMQAALHANGNRWSIGAKDDEPWPPQEGELWLTAFARLSEPAQAPALASALSPPVTASLHRLLPSRKLPFRVALAPFGHGDARLARAYGGPLRALMIMVALMLLIAVANVATLLLARMVRRQREIAIRLALGISRGRLARQLLTEGLLLAAISGAAAIGVAVAASRLMVRLAANPFQPSLDWRVWIFLAGIALVTGIALGLLPAWAAERTGPSAGLKIGDSAQAGAGRVPLGRGLVVVQVALSLLLVAGAGLFSRSLAAMFHLALGFDSSHMLTASLTLPDSGVPKAELAVLDQRLLQRLAALPGVRTVALDQNGLDNFSADTSGISLAGRVDPPGGLSSNEETVSRDFFQAVGMTLLRGRNFLTTDTANGPSVVVVNQAFARRFYPGEDPLGKTFGYSPDQTGHFRIVGIVADARVQDPHTPAAPLFYRLLEQSGNPALRVEVRAAGDPVALTSAVRAAIGGVDPRLRVGRISSVNHRLDEMLQRDQLVAQLSGGFAALALALACLGLFGVMAYAVAARGGEFGIRMALGAGRGQVLGMVLREVMLLLAAGLAVGLPLALWSGHWLQPLLPGIRADDPVSFAAAALLMAAAPLLAALPPAWRAATTDPARALRAE